jgi:ribonucleoside-triphosphate reductase (thioredoxin)
MKKNKPNNVGQELLSNFRFYNGYSKYNEKTNKYENWDESVDRVFDEMHQIKFENVLKNNSEFLKYYEFAKDMYKKKYVLASQRSLQFGGAPILKHNAKLYNCITSYCDRIRFFQDSMYWLLCGCGVGFSVQKKHIENLPKIKKRSNRSKVHIIEDSIEGWSDAIGILLSSYFDGEVTFPKYQNCYVSFDYTEIRPKGALISGGFKAPGADGLRSSILKIEELLEKELDRPNFNGTVESIVAYDIVMHMSDAVLSGGVRRSATICLFSPDDKKMITAKTGNWFTDNPQRARSNNTVLLNKNTVTKEEFSEYFKYIKEFGEPGFGFTESEDIIYNPCFEIGMRPQTEEGVSGFQGCNLVEINGNQCDTEEEFYSSCKAAAIIGTMQAAYTDFKYVESTTKEIFEREALLGCSITGFMNNPKILLNPEIQRNGAEIIKKINKEVAEMIGIRQAARTTCVKPSGNASVLLKTASGIHGEHSERYIRNVQVNMEDDIAKHFNEINPKMFEKSVWSTNGTDWVISFPIVANKNSIFKDELIGVKLLEAVKITQENWVEFGTNVELCTDPTMRHNVSNTVIVDNWEEVENYIFDNKKWFSGVSLLPLTGDKDYNQAPFTSILTPEELVKKYGDAAIFASGLIVDGLTAFNNNLWLACDTIMGLGEKLEYTDSEIVEKMKCLTPNELWKNLGFKNGTLEKLTELQIKPEIEEYKRYLDSKLPPKIHNYVIKRDWIRRAKQFSERYFQSHKEMTYCLKDVNNHHKWVEINREIIDINWDELNIRPNYINIDTTGAIACSGGACEII